MSDGVPSAVASKVRARPGSLAIRLVGLLVSLGALWLVLHSVDLEPAATVLSHANTDPPYRVSGCHRDQVVLRSIRWRLLLPPPPGGGHTKLRGSFRYFSSVIWETRSAGRGWASPFGPILIARREQLDARRGIWVGGTRESCRHGPLLPSWRA